MGLTAAVAGASGYAGGELLRLLLHHPDLAVGPLAAGSSAGQPVLAVHPRLVPLHERVFGATDAEELGGADVVFLALPHGESAALAARLPAGTPVVDLGADHRLRDPDQWSSYYAGPHAGSWPYGLPELPGAREQLRGARRVAAAGCYVTATSLALAPLVSAGVVEPDDVVVVAMSGTSGAGRAAKPGLLGSEVMGDLSPYKVAGAHQHIPEILQNLGVAGSLSFTPVLAPMPRGILVTATARTRSGTAELRDTLRQAYGEEPFVHLLPEGTWPHTAATLGSNACHLQVAADERAGRAVVVAALDNLGKGAAGQALQCANLALGLPETTGLTAVGTAP